MFSIGIRTIVAFLLILPTSAYAAGQASDHLSADTVKQDATYRPLNKDFKKTSSPSPLTEWKISSKLTAFFSYNHALKLTRDPNNKSPLLVIFANKKQTEGLLNNPNYLDALKYYRIAIADSETLNGRRLAKLFSITTYPSVAIIDSSGKNIHARISRNLGNTFDAEIANALRHFAGLGTTPESNKGPAKSRYTAQEIERARQQGRAIRICNGEVCWIEGEE